MSISMLTAPLAAQREGMPVLILGFEQGELYERVGDTGPRYRSYWNALCVDDDGRLLACPVGQIEVDWRYDWKVGGWREVGDTSGAEDDAVDGSPELPGSVSEPYVAGEGDQVNEEG